MRKILPFFALSIFAIPAMAQANPQTGSGETDGYKLVWQDLFDAEELNPLCWDIEVNGNGGGNEELQYYTDNPANVRLGDDGNGNGCLILTARRENYLGKAFTSGRVNSKGRTAFTHGKMEASIKLPKTANGLWPAFWMMGNDFDDVGWPRCGETDILEMGHSDGIKNGNSDRYFNGASHWGPFWPNASNAKALSNSYSLQDDEFHLYTVIWTPEVIKMYLDLDKKPKQNPYYTFKCPQDDPDNEWSAGNYFHKPNFILFNLAIGGNFPGIKNPKDITALNDGNGHEASMYINYVKIYQKGDPSETLEFIEYPDPTEVSLTENDTPEEKIEIDEEQIVASGELHIYSLDGRELAYSRQGRISRSFLESGIYIARSGSSSLKIRN